MNNETLIIALVAAGLIVNIITLVVVLTKRKNPTHSATAQINPGHIAPSLAGSAETQGVVFCRSCGNQYDSALNACPNCKTAR